MTAGNPLLNLLDLPIEIVEDVVLRLRAQEILKLRIVMLFLSCFCGFELPTSIAY